MMTAPSNHINFADIFRQEMHSALEYSFSLEPQTYGTMIAGVGPRFIERITKFARYLSYAAEFLDIVDRFAAHVATDAYLFKADWCDEVAERLSLYYRFIHGIPANDLERAFEGAHSLYWEGPTPHSIGETIGAGSPVIVGLRVDKNGRFQSSVYFNYVEARHDQFPRRILKPLSQLLDWTPGLSESISQDIGGLLPHSSHAAIGFDSASATKPLILKIAAANVSWDRAATTLSKKNVPQSRLLDLAVVGRNLRQPRLNYLAMKFGPSGFIGWKLYWAMLGQQQSSASPTRIVLS